ncbi:hypothetical protein [Phenylobacterium sp.]|uniref:hypothetical protein n=1 Tax=Phenylobacterium sp. TaxID=1871053 RepID=UPI0025D211CA|nr:hypothetical protein [Phenylobacterium sp.]
MEELHRIHKDVPFGWVLWLQEIFGQAARKRAVRDGQVGARKAAGGGYVPGDLHCLSGPH